MSELKNTLFGEDETIETIDLSGLDDEIDGQEGFSEAYEPVVNDVPDEPENAETPEDMIRESMSAVERMRREIAAENENLDRRFAAHKSVERTAAAPKRRPVYVVGILSAAASLIFMGAALLITTLTSPVGAYTAVKLSPVMLIFIGAEIVYAIFRRHSLRIRIDLRSVIIIAALIAVSAGLSVISVTASSGTGERVYAEQRIQNMLADELHDTIAKDYIRSVDIETQLYGEDAVMYDSPAALTSGDIINLTIYFSDAQMSIREFATECKDILTDIHKLPYNFKNIEFVADDLVNHYVLVVDWHYQSDFDVDHLAALVNYFGNGISDHDIPDAVDDE